MVRLATFILLASVAALAAGQSSVLPRLLGTIPLRHPAFIQLFGTEKAGVDPLDYYTLYISTFDAYDIGQKDDIYVVRSPGRELGNLSAVVPTQIDRENNWPNDPNYLPSAILGREGIIWNSGFLVPGKQNGALNTYFTDVDPIELAGDIASLDEKSYSYHRTVWLDVNGDGSLDAITARFFLDTTGGAGAQPSFQLLWLENPGNYSATGWAQHVAFENGPDVHFRVTTFNVAGQDFTVVVSAEFFAQRLAIYYAADGSTSFLTDPSTLIQRVIDDVNVGQAFDLEVDDLNLDGRNEIILCGYNFTYGGNVFVFPVPDDFRTDEWERITIASGFMPVPGDNYMSPGAPHKFYKGIQHEQSGEKPYVFVSGDDDGCHYILEPLSQDPNNWDYTKHQLLNTTLTTTGKYAIADVDNDGINEIFAAAYSGNEIYVYTYAD